MSARARVIVAGATNVGMKRAHNEDSYAIFEESRLYVVADGMGGHASGEVASRMAIEALHEFFDKTDNDDEVTWPFKMDKSFTYEENRLITGMKLANLRVHRAAEENPKLRGMGTTLVAVLVVDDGVLIGHVGDSRVYRLRKGELQQLTEDHSLLNDYIKMRRLSAEEIENFPHKNVIVRALGMKEQIKVDTYRDLPQPGDCYIMCSDGLSGPVSDDEILTITTAGGDLRSTCQALIDRANEHGGPDNITVVIAKVMGTG